LGLGAWIIVIGLKQAAGQKLEIRTVCSPTLLLPNGVGKPPAGSRAGTRFRPGLNATGGVKMRRGAPCPNAQAVEFNDFLALRRGAWTRPVERSLLRWGRKPGSRASSALRSVFVFQAAQQFGLAALQLGLAGAGRAQAGGLVAGDTLQDALDFLPGAVLGLHRHPQALGLLGLDLGLHPQALGLGAGAGRFLAAGLDHQVGTFTVELVDLAPDGLGVGGDLGRFHPPFGHLQRGVALAGAGLAQGVQGLAGLQPLEVGEGVAGRIGVDRPQPLGQALDVRVRLLLGQARRRGGHGRQPDGEDEVPGHAHGCIPSCSRRREIWARRWASSVLATASRLRARARSATAAAATAAVRASRWLPPDIADWAWDSSARACSSSAGAYWSASASAARATACGAAE